MLGLAVAFLQAACGSAASQPSATTTATTSQAPGGQGGEQASRKELVVFAAASLAEPFAEIGSLFEHDNPEIRVVFNFGGSQQLRSQMEQGARADVFASANRQEMERALTANLVDQSSVFAHNGLVVILPKGNSGKISRLQDLARPGVRLDLAHRDVPVGGYTLTSFDKMSSDPSFGPNFKADVLANVRSEEDDVKKVVTKVLLGEADAGVVYSSDVTAKVRPEVETIGIPSLFNVVADYPIAPTKDSRQQAAAKAFIDFVLSSKGQAALVQSGFIPERAPIK